MKFFTDDVVSGDDSCDFFGRGESCMFWKKDESYVVGNKRNRLLFGLADE